MHSFYALVLSQLMRITAANTPTPQSIDINHASAQELTTLPGVGIKRADAIVKFRSKKPFHKITDIMRVKGIGQKRFNQMKPYIKAQK